MKYIETRCEGLVNSRGLNFVRQRRCTNPGKHVHKGKYYCKTHNPIMRKAREEKRVLRWQEKYQLRMENRLHTEKEIKKLQIAAALLNEFEEALQLALSGLTLVLETAKKNGDPNFLGYVLTHDKIKIALKKKEYLLNQDVN